MNEEDWLAIRLFIKKKWPSLYDYHSHPAIGWECCFLKEDTVRRWRPKLKAPKTFDKGKVRILYANFKIFTKSISPFRF